MKKRKDVLLDTLPTLVDLLPHYMNPENTDAKRQENLSGIMGILHTTITHQMAKE